MPAIDILILSNGPGELTTWVKPVVRALRHQLGHDHTQVRISVVLSPCANATGQEAAIAQSYPEVDRVQGADQFFPFLLWGKTAETWDWCDRGVVIFLGGDQFYTLVIGKRLGYKTLTYAEWDARWHGWIDRFAVMQPQIIDRAPAAHRQKMAVVGDLMAEAAAVDVTALPQQVTPLIGLLPGSKAAKLAQGVPLCLAIAERLHAVRPDLQFVIPVAPTLDPPTLARFADPQQNSVLPLVEGVAGELITSDGKPSYLKTPSGLQISLCLEHPAYQQLAQCTLCVTTVGANTAELGALAVPMIVIIPTQQLDAMRAWDGLPGLLANLPGVGSMLAKIINRLALRRLGLLAWPNIWAGEQIVPELIGQLRPQEIADQILDWLDHPEQLAAMRDRLRQVRGQPGAAQKLAQMVGELVVS